MVRFRALVGVTVLAVGLGACSSSTTHASRVRSGPGLVDVPGNAQLAVSSVRRAPADPTNVNALVAANTQFAFDLYHQLVKESPGTNLVFSPESISYALAMTYAGTRSTTATQIAKAMHFDALPADELNAAFNALSQELLAPRTSSVKGRTPLRLSMSNSEWGQRGFPFVQAYLDTLARYYGAGLRLSDFIHDAEHERQRINAYVAEQTDGRILELLPAGIIDSLTRLVLVNTINFTAAWRTPFDVHSTSSAPFTRIDRTHVQVPMMSGTGEPESLDGYRGDGFVAARLPYEGGASMLLIVPDAGRFNAVEQQLSPALVDQITTGLKPGADVSMPKFDFTSQLHLPPALQALGIRDAFDPNRANLNGIAPDEGLYVSDIVHDATITVDEQGTKAAAATAVIISATGLASGILDVRADRPFIYLIRDDATKAILFIGRTLDPTQT